MNEMQNDEAVIIRPASFNDITFIKQIAQETWPLAYGKILSPAQLNYMLNLIYSSEALGKQLLDNQHFFLALKNFVPIGFAAFSHIHQQTYKLQKLYVSPLQHKTGAGKQLLAHVIATVKSRGGLLLQLNVNRQNTAISFYVKQGFAIIKQEDIDIGQGFFMNDYVMEKSLA